MSHCYINEKGEPVHVIVWAGDSKDIPDGTMCSCGMTKKGEDKEKK